MEDVISKSSKQNKTVKPKKHSSKESAIMFAARTMCEHPFISAAFLCFFCTVFTTPEGFHYMSFFLPGVIFFFCAEAGADYISDRIPKLSARAYSLASGFAALLFAIAFSYIVSIAEKPQLIILQTIIAVSIISAVYLSVLKLMTAKKACLLLIVMGFAMRFAYIMSISIRTKQHDVGSVEKMKGHLGYIAYLLFNGTLPQMDVRTVDQFYHPPLHHIIAALWVKFQTIMGIGLDYAWENIQILTLFYSCICMILAYKLFRKIGLRGLGLVAAMAIIAFCPTFYILAGSINNDILCITFMLAALLNALYWLENRTLSRIMIVAVCVGCAMMSKLSGWMVAPAIAVIFIYGLIKDIKVSDDKGKVIKNYAIQFGAFLPASAVLGLWWGVRNLLKDDVPITFIIRMSDKSDMYVGDIPLMKRLFDFNFSQFTDVSTGFKRYNVGYNEYNPLVGLIKTSDFDELFTIHYYSAVEGFDKLLFWSTVAVALIGFASMIYCFVADKGIKVIHKVFLGTLYGVIIVSYYSFCIAFPHICTMNIRYAVPLIVVGAFFVGRLVQISGEAKGNKDLPGTIISYLVTSAAGLYSLASVLFYVNVFK